MAPGKRRKVAHLPVFAGVKAILIPGHFGITKVSWPVVQKRFSELHGTQVQEMTADITHVVAGTWLSVMKKWSWSFINSAICKRGLKVVDTSWLIDSIRERSLQDTNKYELWEGKEATAEAEVEQEVWEAKAEQARLAARVRWGPVVNVGRPPSQLSMLYQPLELTDPIFTGVSMVFAEKGIGETKCKMYKSLVINLGGKVEESLTNTCTHVIGKSYPKIVRKFGKRQVEWHVMNNNVWVLSPGWLVESAAAGKQRNPWDFDMFEAWPPKQINDPHAEDYVTSCEDLEDSEDGTE